jgi:hypothetical protein
MTLELLVKLLKDRVAGPENFPARGHQLARIHAALEQGATLWGTAHRDLLMWTSHGRRKPTWEEIFKVLANTLAYSRRRRAEDY